VPASPNMLNFESGPLTVLHLAIIALCACGFAIDLSELALGNVLSVVFSAAPNRLSTSELSCLLSSVFLGSIAGAPLMGFIADRLGLKSVLAATLLWLGATSVSAGVSVSPMFLIAFRLLSGLALGAYPPLMISYLTDVSPINRRGRVIFVTCAFAYLGPPAVIFGVRWLTPLHPVGLDGWRWPFLGGGLLCLVAGLLFLRAPEAPHWLEAVGRTEAVEAVLNRFRRSSRLKRAAPFEDKPASETRVIADDRAEDAGDSTLPGCSGKLQAVSLLYFLIPWATVAFPLMTGPMLLARHYSLSDALLYVGLATFGPVFGTLVGGFAVDRIDRRSFMAACACGMLVAIVLFFVGWNLLATALALILFGTFSALYLPAMTMFGAELFDARDRGRATTLAWVANRIGATLAPIALVPLIRCGDYGLVAGVMCGTIAANLVVLRWLPGLSGT